MKVNDMIAIVGSSRTRFTPAFKRVSVKSWDKIGQIVFRNSSGIDFRDEIYDHIFDSW
jgi:hypothetical protein